MTNETKTETVTAIQSANVPALFFNIDRGGKRINDFWQCDRTGYTQNPAAREKTANLEASLYFNANNVLDFEKCLKIRDVLQSSWEQNNARFNTLEENKATALGYAQPLHYSYKKAVSATTSKNENWIPHYEILAHGGALTDSDIVKLYEAWESGPGVGWEYRGRAMQGPFNKSDNRPCPIPKIEAAYNYVQAKKAFDLAHNSNGIKAAYDDATGAEWGARLAVWFSPVGTAAQLASKLDFIVNSECTSFDETKYCDVILKGLARDAAAIANLKNLKSLA